MIRGAISAITKGSYTDKTQDFTLDKRQREQYYDYSRIVRKSGALDDSIDDHLSYEQTNYDILYEWLKSKNKERI